MKQLSFIIILLAFGITEYIAAEIKPEFHITPLGHYGFLIKCEIPNVNENNTYVAEYTIEDAETGGKAEKYFTIGDFLSKTVLYLTANTKYRIEVHIKHWDLEKPIISVLEAKTNSLSLKAPYKPDFRINLKPELYSFSLLIITWLPCGVKRDCGDSPAGEHFYVKYKEKGVADEFINRKELVDEILVTGCRPGRIYEFIVVSVYGDRETESDPQEIEIPEAAPDLDFKVTLVNEDVILPCKLPKASKNNTAWNFPSNFRNQHKTNHMANGDLLIKDVTLFDAGTYECYIPTNQRLLTSWKIFLDVKSKTFITNEDQFDSIKTVKVGKNFEMPCVVKSDKSLAVFVDWCKNSESIDFSDDDSGYQLLRKDNTLVISKPTLTSSGNYTCIAKTRLDSKSASFYLNVL